MDFQREVKDLNKRKRDLEELLLQLERVITRTEKSEGLKTLLEGSQLPLAIKALFELTRSLLCGISVVLPLLQEYREKRSSDHTVPMNFKSSHKVLSHGLENIKSETILFNETKENLARLFASDLVFMNTFPELAQCLVPHACQPAMKQKGIEIINDIDDLFDHSSDESSVQIKSSARDKVNMFKLKPVTKPIIPRLRISQFHVVKLASTPKGLTNEQEGPNGMPISRLEPNFKSSYEGREEPKLPLPSGIRKFSHDSKFSKAETYEDFTFTTQIVPIKEPSTPLVQSLRRPTKPRPSQIDTASPSTSKKPLLALLEMHKEKQSENLCKLRSSDLLKNSFRAKRLNSNIIAPN